MRMLVACYCYYQLSTISFSAFFFSLLRRFLSLADNSLASRGCYSQSCIAFSQLMSQGESCKSFQISASFCYYSDFGRLLKFFFFSTFTMLYAGLCSSSYFCTLLFSLLIVSTSAISIVFRRSQSFLECLYPVFICCSFSRRARASRSFMSSRRP